MKGRLIKIIFASLIIVILIALSLGVIYFVTEPSITLKGSNVVEATLADGYTEPGYEAKYWFLDITDRVEVTTDLNEKKVGEYSVEYSVSFFDKSASSTRTVNMVDREPPIITLNGGDTIKILTNSDFDDPGYSAQDDSDGDVTESVKAKGIVDTFDPGTYTISYSVSDSFGNEADKKRTVIVEGTPEVKPKKVIYLTFDDGPSETVTPEILKTLKKYNVPATFFIVDYGQDAEKIRLLKEAIAQGHTIGIHGYSHDYGEIYKTVPGFMDNLFL